MTGYVGKNLKRPNLVGDLQPHPGYKLVAGNAENQQAGAPFNFKSKFGDCTSFMTGLK
jgi:hypothetical protein